MNFGDLATDAVKIGDSDVEAIYIGDSLEWPSYAGPASPITITTSQTLVAGVDFPANTELSVCMVGAGGGGGSKKVHLSPHVGNQFTGGGYAGQTISQVVAAKDADTTVVVTIGVGGLGTITTTSILQQNGNQGGSTVFDGITATGGAGGSGGSTTFAGQSQGITTCGGTANNGSIQTAIAESTDARAYGGQSSGVANGGNGRIGITSGNLTGFTGGPGSGGGATQNSSSLTSHTAIGGTGGRGEIKISWS